MPFRSKACSVFNLIAWLITVAIIVSGFEYLTNRVNVLDTGLRKLIEIQHEETLAAQKRADAAQSAVNDAKQEIVNAKDEIKTLSSSVATEIRQHTPLIREAKEAAYEAKQESLKAEESSRLAHAATISTRQQVQQSVVTSKDKIKLNNETQYVQGLAKQYNQDLRIVKKQLKSKH